ncbi:MAG TPA: RHS repeat-associated core domain-containing protein [Nitrososphaera sp.]|nr:RHS repeat-associated core domain-containing protein [Nitrososphaera sp.]
MRRYQSRWTRFSQPDPYDGSYDITNPQSFNRYSYVKNDPVNMVDPTGLIGIPFVHFPFPPIGPPPSSVDIPFPSDTSGVLAAVTGGGGPHPRIWSENENRGRIRSDRDAKYSEDKFRGCLNQMDIDLVAFDPNDRTGSYSFFRDMAGKQRIDAIYSDTWKYDSKQLAEKTQKSGMVVGWTPSTWRGLNYVASDYAQKAPLVAVTATRIHEIGNSIFNQTGRTLRPWLVANYPDLAARDDDPGIALEACVFGGHVQPNGTVSTNR